MGGGGTHFHMDAEDVRCTNSVFVPRCWPEPNADTGQSRLLLSSMVTAHRSSRDGAQLTVCVRPSIHLSACNMPLLWSPY